MKNGFHPEFTMQVLNDDEIITASLDMWLERLGLDGPKNPNKFEHKFNSSISQAGPPYQKMEIFENSRQLYTDYFSLYKF